MRNIWWLPGLMTLLIAGCAGEAQQPNNAAAPASTVTVTATATVTETVDARDGRSSEPPASASDASGPGGASDRAVPQLDVKVYKDGCGVIRSQTPPDADYHNLTWVIRDQGGFQVLGRNAKGETRYRYFRAGTYTVVLEAFIDGQYKPVSNTVTIHC